MAEQDQRHPMLAHVSGPGISGTEVDRQAVHGFSTIESNEEEWLQRMRALAREISTREGSVTSDPLRRHANMYDDHPYRSSAWSRIFEAPGWIRIGFTDSKYKSKHGRVIRVWRYEGVSCV